MVSAVTGLGFVAGILERCADMGGFFITVLLVSAVFFGWPKVKSMRVRRIRENGEVVAGRLLMGERVKTRKVRDEGATTTFPGYTKWQFSYNVDGVEYRSSQRGEELEEETIKELTGGMVTVYYDPKKPKRAWADLPDGKEQWYGMYGEKAD